MEESVRMTEDRDKWRKYVHMVWPTLGSRTAKEQNRTEQFLAIMCEYDVIHKTGST